MGGQAFVHHPRFSVNLYYELVAEGTPRLEQIAHAHFFSIHTYRFSNKTINKECNQKLHTLRGHMTQSHGKKVVTEAHTVHGGLHKKILIHCTRPHTSRWYNWTALQLDWLVLHFHANNAHENRGKHETKLRWFSSPRHVLKVERGLYANFGVQGGFTAIQGDFFSFFLILSVCSGGVIWRKRAYTREIELCQASPASGT